MYHLESMDGQMVERNGSSMQVIVSKFLRFEKESRFQGCEIIE